MARTIDQIRASKLPSNLMQFAARGALQVSAAENIEILVYLARHNPVFGPVARMTLAGWDEKASLVAAADPTTPIEVLEYLIAPDNLRPPLLPALLENPSISEAQVAKLAIGASRDSIEVMLKSPRVRSLRKVLEALQANPYVVKERADEIRELLTSARPTAAATAPDASSAGEDSAAATETPTPAADSGTGDEWADDEALASARQLPQKG